MLCRRMLLAALMLTVVVGCASNESAQKEPEKEQALAAFKPSPQARAKDRAYAYLDAMRADLSRGKVQVITGVMELSGAEGKIFWPIYHDYEEELFALGDQRLELTRRYVKAVQVKSLDDAAASELGSAWWDYEAKRLALVRKYYDQIAKELSPLRAAQFAQIEHRFGVVVDLMLASDLPLIGEGM